MLYYRMNPWSPLLQWRIPPTRWIATVPCLALIVLLASCGDNPGPEPVASSEPAPITEQPSPPRTPAAPRPRIVCIGDSLTAGFGLPSGRAYPALLQKRLDERGYDYEVVNAGVSGDTSAGGLRRIDRALSGDVRVVILELGANDGLRGLSPADLRRNLNAMVRAGKSRGASVLIAGMEAPPNLGEEYRSSFRSAFAEVGREHNVPVIPFFLEGVAGRFEYNQYDGIHPNEVGTNIVMETVWKYLEPLLEPAA
jgi:acyl-CoA thioesterase-1